MTSPVWTQWNCTIKKVTDPVWNHSYLALLLILQATNPVWIQSHVAILLIRQAVKDWLWIHCQCAIKEPTNPINFECHCTIKRMTNPVWIQCQCTIKEMANPVWIQGNFTIKNLTDPIWNHSHLALLTILHATNPVWIQCKCITKKLQIQAGSNGTAPKRRWQIQSGTTLMWRYFWHSKRPIQSVFNLIWLFFWFAKLLYLTLDPLPMRSKRTVNKSNKFPMPLHHEQNDKPSLDTMPMQHKGDGKSSLDLMELHQKELDRSSLEPLSFGFTYDAPSYQSSLDLNPVWNHFHVALVLVFQATNPVWIQCKGLQWNCPQRRRQIQSGTTLIWLCFWYSKLPIQCGAKPSLDPTQVHHKGAGKSSLDPTKKVTDPVWNHSHSALLLVLQATNPL